MRMSDWSSDVCSSDLQLLVFARRWLYQSKILILRDRDIRVLVTAALGQLEEETAKTIAASVLPEQLVRWRDAMAALRPDGQTQQSWLWRSEEHTSELQSLMRISYAVFCLKKKRKKK